MTHPADPPLAPDHAPDGEPPFDKSTGTSGQGYTRDDELRLGAQNPAGAVSPRPSQIDEHGATTPPDNGRRASFDPATGAVRGSGAGAGGGHAGEDPDPDSASGNGPPLTGVAAPRPD
jgi:hypothetical protein